MPYVTVIVITSITFPSVNTTTLQLFIVIFYYKITVPVIVITIQKWAEIYLLLSYQWFPDA